ncbi:MAG: hypothetical protein E6J90_36745 [Deltaproteobacteria bacterium]|nr:MAG: hypothetical protein E6J90_36745 [Deltaproteobacteria bacterium]
MRPRTLVTLLWVPLFLCEVGLLFYTPPWWLDTPWPVIVGTVAWSWAKHRECNDTWQRVAWSWERAARSAQQNADTWHRLYQSVRFDLDQQPSSPPNGGKHA